MRIKIIRYMISNSIDFRCRIGNKVEVEDRVTERVSLDSLCVVCLVY